MHSSVTRDREKLFAFSDTWEGLREYADFMELRLREISRVLKTTGSVFLHCDSSANFLLRRLLGEIFGEENFQSEIIWAYRRWSNSARALLPAHQTILFFSKSGDFKFNKIYGAYSETTNVDQILQLRGRDEDGVSVYATGEDGKVIYSGDKKGVPLSDVWEIPFLNPKAKERTGYPTQKPLLLLERILTLASEPGDVVLDPFCGSGTTLVAAHLLGRSCIGVDSSPEAVDLTERRLADPKRTDSALMKLGRSAYATADKDALAYLQGLDFLPVQRNAGIDAFLKTPLGGAMVPIRVQRASETIADAASKLASAAKSKNSPRAILVRTTLDDGLFNDPPLPPFVELIDATALSIRNRVSALATEIAMDEASRTSAVAQADK